MGVTSKTIVAGGLAMWAACMLSENARNAFSYTFERVAPPIINGISAIPYVVTSMADYGYEFGATVINNFDLIIAGGVAASVTYAATAAFDRRGSVLGKATRTIATFAVAAAAVCFTATQARKLGYEVGLPQLTETGQAITGWGRDATVYRGRRAPDTTPRFAPPAQPSAAPPAAQPARPQSSPPDRISQREYQEWVCRERPSWPCQIPGMR